MIIELKGGQAENIGAKLMLTVTRDRLRAAFPEAKIALRQTSLLDVDFRRSFGAVRKLPLRKRMIDLNGFAYALPSLWWSRILGEDTVLESQVDAVIDLSGFAYGDRWGEGSLRATSAEIQRLGARHRPYVFLPQAFGPFENIGSAVTAEFGRSLRSSGLVCARDRRSFASVAALMGTNCKSLSLCPDITFATQVARDQVSVKGCSSDTALIVPNVRMTERISSGEAASLYVPTMLQLAADARAQGFSIKVLNHGGREDRSLCRSFTDRLGAELLSFDDPYKTKAMIRQAGLVISSRFHACVAALSQGVPCIATAWSHKYRELFSPFGLEYAVLERGGEPSYVPLIERVLADVARRAEELAVVRAATVCEVDAMWNRIYSILAVGVKATSES